MFPKMTRRTKVPALLGLLCLLLLVGAIYLHYQHTAAPVQERIYGVPERSERQAVQPATAFQQPPVHSTAHTHVAEAPHHGDIDSAHDHESDTSAPTDAENHFLTETEFSEEPLHTESAVDVEQVRIAGIASQIEKLGIALNEKYPEIARLATVSPAELEELYPTPEDRQALAELGQKVLAEFTDEFRSLFSQLPADVQEDSLAEAHDHFTTYMGRGMADAIMTELRSRLEQ